MFYQSDLALEITSHAPTDS